MTVHLSFYIGAAVFLAAVLYTIATTPEKPPADMAAFEAEKAAAGGGPLKVFGEIARGIVEMPKVMRQLAVVQFFTWLGLFCMWIYFAPAVAHGVFGGEPGSASYQAGAEWAGVCFSVYNGTAFVFAFALIALTRFFSAKALHRVCLACAGAGLLSVALWKNQYGLLVSMAGVGVGWAGILSMPYAMLSNAIPAGKMGFYMGVFNFFIVLPQILAATVLGSVVGHVFGGRAMPAVVVGGAAMLVAAAALSFVQAEEEGNRSRAGKTPPALGFPGE